MWTFEYLKYLKVCLKMHANICILNISLNFVLICASVLTLKLKSGNCLLQYLMTIWILVCQSDGFILLLRLSPLFHMSVICKDERHLQIVSKFYPYIILAKKEFPFFLSGGRLNWISMLLCFWDRVSYFFKIIFKSMKNPETFLSPLFDQGLTFSPGWPQS